MFLLVGPKRGGKGTIARVLRAMVGAHNVAGPTLASLGTGFGLQDLIAKPVAIISDARLGGKTDSSVVTERLLSISGEDTLTVDRKYRDHWTGQLPTRIVMLTNELPKFTDSSGALASRFIVFAMTKSFYGRENPRLTHELCTELPGIFNWALDGLERFRERGYFRQPQTSSNAIQQIEDLSSPVGAFIRDCGTIGPDFSVPRADLYKAYREWCDDRGHTKQNSATFARNVYAAYPQIRRTQPRNPDESRADMYAGIKLGTGGTGANPLYCQHSGNDSNRQNEYHDRAAPVPPVPDGREVLL
jgi:putative DNA primase/helicase